MRKYPIASIFGLICGITLGWIMLGCAHLQSGADPLVVRAEQVETAGKATVDLLFNLDNADRGFWRTNAPAFHSFVENLRKPVQTSAGTTAKGYAVLISLDDVKRDYKASRTSSNALWEAIATAEPVVSQAAAWQTIIEKTPTR